MFRKWECLEKNQEEVLEVFRYFLKDLGFEEQILFRLKDFFVVSIFVIGVF